MRYGAFKDFAGLITASVIDTEINGQAFQNIATLRTVYISDSVTSVGMYAFLESDNVTLILTSNNGLGLSAGSQTVGDNIVNVVIDDSIFKNCPRT